MTRIIVGYCRAAWAKESDPLAGVKLQEKEIRRFAKCQVIYNRSKVTLLGSVPVQRGTYQSAAPVPFRIEGELDRKAIRARPHSLQPDDGRWKKLQDTTTEHLPAVVTLSSF